MVRKRQGMLPPGSRAHLLLGKRIHWLWNHHGAPTSDWRKLGTSKRAESRVVGFLGDYALGWFIEFGVGKYLLICPNLTGYCEYVYGASRR